jgi:hypothetical protein
MVGCGAAGEGSPTLYFSAAMSYRLSQLAAARGLRWTRCGSAMVDRSVWLASELQVKELALCEGSGLLHTSQPQSFRVFLSWQ